MQVLAIISTYRQSRRNKGVKWCLVFTSARLQKFTFELSKIRYDRVRSGGSLARDTYPLPTWIVLEVCKLAGKDVGHRGV